jgi:hypothetical protein
MDELPPHLRDIPLFVRAELAMREAARQAIIEHRRYNVPLVYGRDGKVVLVPPYDVPLPEMDPLTAEFKAAAAKRRRVTCEMWQREEAVISPLIMRPQGRTL